MAKKNFPEPHNMRSTTWARFCDIFEHFGILETKRYDQGCFLSLDTTTGKLQLTEFLSFHDKTIRDTLAEAFSSTAQIHALEHVHVSTKDEASGHQWPHSLGVSVSSNAPSVEDADNEMASFLAMMVQDYPPPLKGTSWSRYRASYRVEDHINRKEAGKDSAKHRDRVENQIRVFSFISDLYRYSVLRVVGECSSKNLKLPVVQLTMPENATKVTIGDNCREICVSVDSSSPIQNTRNFCTLFDITQRNGHFEGFPNEQVFGCYQESPKRFSLCVDHFPDLLMLLGEIFRQDSKAEYAPPPRLTLELRPKPPSSLRSINAGPSGYGQAP